MVVCAEYDNIQVFLGSIVQIGNIESITIIHNVAYQVHVLHRDLLPLIL